MRELGLHPALCATASGLGVRVCVVVGFPLGAMATQVKAFEAAAAIDDGARKIEMVLNVGALKANDLALVRQDGPVCAARVVGALLKVIFETCLLVEAEKRVSWRRTRVPTS